MSVFDPALRGPPMNVDVRDEVRNCSLGSGRSSRTVCLPVITGNEPPPSLRWTRAKRRVCLLGMRDYVRWQDTVLDTVDDLLRVERELVGRRAT